jgi:hypothetical protein
MSIETVVAAKADPFMLAAPSAYPFLEKRRKVCLLSVYKDGTWAITQEGETLRRPGLGGVLIYPQQFPNKYMLAAYLAENLRVDS